MFPPITTHDGRRALAFLGVMGGCVVFTLFAAVSLWLLRDHPGFVFWLALAAHVQILVGMTALGWQMGRRLSASAGRDGVSISDRDGGQHD
ncbi:hypothetical protein [Pseudorhodoplanes sp.]|uniref:hypothetical protein n=1 Tax=Pseudorhodoplanes sp. TaxID=1934341 RepID=UPI00391ACD36